MIQEELDRLNAKSITFEGLDTLPEGWIKISNGTQSVFGPEKEILSVLQKHDSGLVWDALSCFSNLFPVSSNEWPADLLTIEQLETFFPNDDPVTLIEVKTNSGTKWACGPHGVSFCALREAFRNDRLFTTLDDAVIAAARA